MKFLQKLGKALMLPVAVLPICGILMGIGYRRNRSSGILADDHNTSFYRSCYNYHPVHR